MPLYSEYQLLVNILPQKRGGVRLIPRCGLYPGKYGTQIENFWGVHVPPVPIAEHAPGMPMGQLRYM